MLQLPCLSYLIVLFLLSDRGSELYLSRRSTAVSEQRRLHRDREV